MSMMEPLMPHPQHEQTIAAADPGTGAPAPAPGFGVGGEEPDLDHDGAAEDDGDQGGTTAVGGVPDGDTPFRTPDPGDVRRAP